jgi:transcriptional regulator with XRE-family HTH domain
MTRPIETVVAEAQQRLETSGRLDIATYLSAYPEHAVELQELLPVVLSVHKEKRWQQAEVASQQFAQSLFAHLTDQPDTATVGGLFQHERAVAGLTLEEQALRSGLPVQALERLAQDRTPQSASNATLKELATKLTAPFGALAKEVKRLLSVEALTQRGSGGAIFTRNSETSTSEEQQALLEQVRNAARKPPEEKK